MDDFGVLTERYGLKPQGKAAPMAASKRSAPVSSNGQTQNYGFGSASNPNYSSSKASWSSNSVGGLDDHLDNLFVGSKKPSADQSGGSSFDYDSIFNPGAKSSSSTNFDNDDIFGLNKSTPRSNGDVFSSFPSPPPPPPRRSSPVGDLLGGYHQNNDDDDDIFGGIGKESRTANGDSSARTESNSAGFDDLIPGFGGSRSSSSYGYTNQPQQSTSSSTLSEDPFSVFESTSKPPRTSSGLFSDPLEDFGQFNGAASAKDDSGKSPTASTIDELEDFAMGKPSRSVDELPKFTSGEKKSPNKAQTSQRREGAGTLRENKHKSGDDLESFFSMGSRSSSAPKSRTTSSTNKKERTGTGQSPPPETPPSIKKASSATNIVDDLSSMFGDASIFGEFEEVEGESEERRRARLGRQTRTQQRVAKAVAEMNQRDYQTQQEQEERRRIAENLDANIKRWAAGKEGNMRALLSSLQYVLWPDCGWESVSLTDLITSTSVKKVYRKATLCVHPDKVQQKGATLQQKYTAEKVFDILKEAWKKFETEELR
ncbi:auxilin-related protein 1 [Punica granatum]|uniref:Auxilin-related protein 1 n=1 Tax=Punica granatum TaxID=22663 RepID=A0A6P8BRS9_PUNGR|nr:auxilin-related protein 1 [Punica granatum]